MNTILKNYLERRLEPSVRPVKLLKEIKGPVITISREYGCPAKKLAQNLSDSLNKSHKAHHSPNKWLWVGKEIIEESAKELHLKKEFITDVANGEAINVIQDILLSFSNKFYPGDLKIKKTIGEVIQSYAARGHVIIVGRGGVSLCSDVQKSLHIKLVAPIEWRINEVSKRQNMSVDEAEKKIKSIDHKRDMLREYFAGKAPDDGSFDVVFNYMKCTEEEIIQSIVKMLEMRDML